MLRLASHDTQLWTHFDVMDNALAQVTGRKRVVLWPPSSDEHLYVKDSSSSVPRGPSSDCMLMQPAPPAHDRYVEGSSSRVSDIDRWNDEEWPLYRRAVGARRECVLDEGDVLFLPAWWWHHVVTTSPISFSIGCRYV